MYSKQTIRLCFNCKKISYSDSLKCPDCGSESNVPIGCKQTSANYKQCPKCLIMNKMTSNICISCGTYPLLEMNFDNKPDFSQKIFNRGIAYFLQKNYKDAVKNLKFAGNRYHNESALTALAECCYYGLGTHQNIHKAIACLEKCTSAEAKKRCKTLRNSLPEKSDDSQAPKNAESKINIPTESNISYSLTFVNHPILKHNALIQQAYFNMLQKAIFDQKLNTEYSREFMQFYKKILQISKTNSRINIRISDDIKMLIYFDFMCVCAYDKKIMANLLHSAYTGNKINKTLLELISLLCLKHENSDVVWDRIINYKKLRQYSDWLKKVKTNYDFAQKTPYKILVTATMSAGKSTFINALAGKKIASTKNLACTGRLHQIYSKPFEDGLIGKWDSELSFDSKNSIIVENEEYSLGTSYESSYFTRKLGGKHFVILDTPGVNAAEHSNHMECTNKVIESHDYNMIVFVINYENLGTNDERDHLKFILKNKPDGVPIIFAVNKIDSRKSDDTSLDNMIHDVHSYLEDTGFKSPEIFFISAKTAYLSRLVKSQNCNLTEDEEDEFDMLSRKFRKRMNIASLYKELGLTYTKADTDNPEELPEYQCGIGFIEDYIINNINNYERN